ncbi:MAG: capsular polysaccharide biosynthesis protein [Rhodobacterales bacterium]|nr:capsular polysaccharide biosynthesis protein [Rhodobacterales bacterium]MDX5499511.1 capsular polysaccharide biosynthesis protein [Rhodobacterales bacterium]
MPALPGMSRRPGDAVGTWGRSPLSPKAEALAAAQDLPLIRVEDAFLRSIAPGRARRRGDGPLGLMIDPGGGVHFDPSAPSHLETLLAGHPLDDSALLDRAREGMARLADQRLSKYNQHDPALPGPPPGYVLIVDQTRGDASIAASGAGYGTFREMLFRAQDDHPGRPIVIRTHPETAAGLREGHFGPEDARDGITLLTDPVAPQVLLEGAIAVYTVSSQLGFEAILAGHRPQVFGRPFYAGWGLTEDHGGPLPRRHRNLTRAQIFAGAMILAPIWYDPCRDRLCSFETALDQLEAEVRAFRDDRKGWVASGMRLWKRGPLQGFFGRERPLRFVAPARAETMAQASGRRLMVWGQTPAGASAVRVEDGLIRSRGLGADLVPPLSLVLDDCGIYYDPTRPSQLERLVRARLRPGQIARADRLIARLISAGVTKYNLGGMAPDVPEGHRILVPGQVEDDASIRLGAGPVQTNLALLERVRAENPAAVILWKPHPDVEAGLRPGAVPAERLPGLADAVLSGVDAAAALDLADEVWTMTSGLGFEALLRGLPVTCLGTPFYAGWGLTRDLGPVPARRQERPTVTALAHAVLIDYPRYRDPITGRPCPVELVVERIASGRTLPRSAAPRLLAKAQGALAGHAWMWRR